MNNAHHMTIFMSLAGLIISSVSTMIWLRADDQPSLMFLSASLIIALILGAAVWLERRSPAVDTYPR